MGLFTNAIGAALGGRKSTSDFMKIKADEEAAKRAQSLAEKQAELNIKKTESDMSAFDPKKIESLAAQTIFEMEQGLPATPAGMAAVKAMATLEGQKTQYKTNEDGSILPYTADNPYSQYLGRTSAQGVVGPESTQDYGGNNYDVTPMGYDDVYQSINQNNPLPLTPQGQSGDPLADFAQANAAARASINQATGEPLLSMPAAQGAALDTGNKAVQPEDLMGGIYQPSPKTKQVAQEEAVKATAGMYDPKIEAEKEAKEQAKARVTSILTDIAGYYDSLQSSGALVDSNKSVLDNLVARTRSSGIGQLTEGALGTEAQDYRNMIEATRPLLVQEIRKATEMGAKGMDSNVELNFYLMAATDPTRSAKANKAALSTLNDAYGIGAKIITSPEDKEQLRAEFSKRMQNIEGGSERPALPPEKQSRLEELRAKRDAGLLQ